MGTQTKRDASRRARQSEAAARFESEGRKMWGGIGDAWTYLSTIMSGIAVWGAAGFGLDHWLGTRPVFFVIGALVGNFGGIYLVYVKSFKNEQAVTTKGVSGDAA